MAVEIKEAPKAVIKESKDIIYIAPGIKKDYVAFFSRPGGEMAAELINSIVALVEEMYMPEHCSLEPYEIVGNILKIKFKVLRPEVRLTSENGLFITLRGFYTEHIFKFMLSDDESVTITILKNVKGSLLNPTLAQASASFAHSHLHSNRFNSAASYSPLSFCLGSSSLSSALYGDHKILDDTNKVANLTKALKYAGKVLHLTESLVHYESISGTPYNYLKSVIERTWERAEDKGSNDIKAHLKKAYHKCLIEIYKDVLINARFPFTLGIPLSANNYSQSPYVNNYTEDYMPIVHTDKGFLSFITKIISPIAADAVSNLNKIQAYKFESAKLLGNYRFMGDFKLCSPSNVWTGIIPTKFKGKELKVGYKKIKYDGEGKQTQPKAIVIGDNTQDSDFITKYMVNSFDLAFKKLIGILLSSYKRDHLLNSSPGSTLDRIVAIRHTGNAHFNVIKHLIGGLSTKQEMVEILTILSLLIRSTINFNNFNHFLDDK